MLYLGLFPCWLPCLYWDSEQLIQCVNENLVRCCHPKHYSALASCKQNFKPNEHLQGKTAGASGFCAQQQLNIKFVAEMESLLLKSSYRKSTQPADPSCTGVTGRQDGEDADTCLQAGMLEGQRHRIIACCD